MTQLTWHDTEIPNLTGGLEGIRIAGEMFGNAMRSAKGVVGDLQQHETEAADNAVMSDLLRYQGNPDSLMADLSSGEFQKRNGNLGRVSAAMREALSKAPGDLLDFAIKKTGYDEGQKTIADKQFIRDNNAIANEHIRLEREGTPEQRAAYREAHPDFYAKANFKMLSDMTDTGQGQFSNDNRNFQDRYNYNNQVATDKERDDSNTIYQNALYEGQGIRYINSNRDELISKYGQNAVNLALSRFQTAGGGGSSFGGAGVGSAGAPGPGTGIGGRNLYDVVLGDQSDGSNAYGFQPPKPISSMSLGELYNYQRSVMVPATAAKGVGNGQGSSAAGAYQIVSKTLAEAAPKVFGANWQNVAFTPENQDKLGEYLFNEAKANGTDLHNVWEGLPRGTSAAGLTWADARGMITRRESGGVADPRRSTVAVDTVLAQADQGREDVRLAQIFSAAHADTSNATQVAAKLTGKGGEFAGENTDNVAALVTKIASKYKVNQAVAGALLAESRDGRQSKIRDPFEWLPWSDGLKSSYNEKRIEELAKLAKDRTGLAKTMVGISDRQNAAAQIQQGNAAVAQVQAALKQEELAAAAEGRKVDYDYWNKQLAAAQGNQGGAIRAGAETALASTPPGTNEAPPPSSRPRIIPTANAAEKPGGKVAPPPKKVEPAKPTAKDINAALADVRRTAGIYNKMDGGTPGFKLLGAQGDYRRSVNAATELAMNSGLPQFKQLPGESRTLYKERISRMLVRPR